MVMSGRITSSGEPAYGRCHPPIIGRGIGRVNMSIARGSEFVFDGGYDKRRPRAACGTWPTCWCKKFDTLKRAAGILKRSHHEISAPTIPAACRGRRRAAGPLDQSESAGLSVAADSPDHRLYPW